MNELTFVILAYSRPERLRMVIDSIHEYVKKPKILVFVDRVKLDPPASELNAQARVIAVCKDSVDAGLIEDYRVSASNQGTKASYFACFTWGFLSSEHVVLLEDDMIFIEDPASFINASIKVFESDKSVGMAVLFANFNHPVTEDSMQITNWPIMWGVLLNSRNYSFISSYLAGSSAKDVSEVVSQFAGQKLKSRLQTIFKDRFERTWRFKYSRALESRTAWDTQWQFALWGLQLTTAVPAQALIADLGVDDSSVSRTRDKMEPVNCRSLFRHSVESKHYCRACESFREVQNFSLPGTLRGNGLLNALLMRGIL